MGPVNCKVLSIKAETIDTTIKEAFSRHELRQMEQKFEELDDKDLVKLRKIVGKDVDIPSLLKSKIEFDKYLANIKFP